MNFRNRPRVTSKRSSRNVLTVAGNLASLLRLNVPPGTGRVVQQLSSPAGPQVWGSPPQLGRSVHTPATHVGVAAAHGVGELHWPPASHVWTPSPEHFVVEGLQTPVQTPFKHA